MQFASSDVIFQKPTLWLLLSTRISSHATAINWHGIFKMLLFLATPM